MSSILPWISTVNGMKMELATPALLCVFAVKKREFNRKGRKVQFHAVYNHLTFTAP